MANIPGIGRLFRLPLTERRVARDVDEEIEFHVAMRTEDLVSRGMDAGEARREALREFGDVEAGRHELARMARRRARLYRRAEVHEWLWRDLRSSLRLLRHDPRFTVGVMIALALGVGANAVVFGMTDRVLLQPPPHVAEPEQVARVFFEHAIPGVGMAYITGYSWPQYASFANQSRALEIAGYGEGEVEIGRGQDAEQATAIAGTGNFFTVLGARPVLGRFFSPPEDVPKRASPVAVLGYGFWQRRYGGSYAAIGSTIELNRITYTIIGVAPPRFNGLGLSPVDLFLPLSAYAETMGFPRWNEGGLSWITAFGRLRDGVARETALAELTALRTRHLGESGDGTTPKAVLAGIMNGGRDRALLGDASARVTLLLLGVSLLVLLVACANVASLMLSRALRRTRELAIRVALGVGRGRLLSLVLGEALLLALGGGVVGVLLAAKLGERLAPVMLPDVDWSGGIVAGRVLLVAAFLVVLSMVLISVLPALYALRADLNITLRAGVREGGGHRAPVRRLLLVLQAALTVVLLTGAGLFVRSLQRAGSVDFGFDGERVIAVTWDTKFVDADDGWWLALYRAAAEQVRALPGVSSVSFARSVPGWSDSNTGGLVTGAGDTVPSLGFGPYFNEVDAAFFGTMGIAVLRGRPFSDEDVAAGSPVVIVDQAFAEMVWPGRDPLRQCLFVAVGAAVGQCSDVVGVVENAMRLGVAQEPTPQFFVPLTAAYADRRGLFVRAAGDADPIAAAIRERLRAMGEGLPRAHVRTLQSHYADDLRPWQIGMTLFLAFGALALLVSLIGVYSVMAYSVATRRHEMGVRMALGARAGEVLRLVIREAARVLVVGLLLGLLLAIALGGLVGSMLFETSPRDPLVLAGVSALLMITGLAAALVPARRAARIQAATMLRAE